MSILPRMSLAEQTALHMQQEIEAGRWKGVLPGAVQLAAELGVSKGMVMKAFAILESRGLIVSHGAGKSREIVAARVSGVPTRSLRVGILLHEDFVDAAPLTQDLLMIVKGKFEALGHAVFHAPKSQVALGLDVDRITRMVERAHADAWIVWGGSGELLSWFRGQPRPFIASGGVIEKFPMAAVLSGSENAITDAVQQLIELGHKRIVLICPPDWVRPFPPETDLVKMFLAQLTSAGLSAGEYNVPYHEETPEGFHQLLDSLFMVTPPTAMIVPNPNYAFAVMSFLNSRGLNIPRDLSLVSRSQGHPLNWGRPQIAHFHIDTKPLIQRFVHWVDHCSKGIPDFDSVCVDASLVPSETIAPPP